MMLITLDQAKEQINVDYDVSDVLIESYVHAASAAVLNYLKSAKYEFLDTSGELLTDSSGIPVEVPHEVQMAVRLMVDEFFAHRGSDGGKEAGWEMGYLPKNVTAVLYPLRDPACV